MAVSFSGQFSCLMLMFALLSTVNPEFIAQRAGYQKIFSHYYNNGTTLTDIIPLKDHKAGPMNVNVSMTLSSLNGFDAVSGQIDIAGVMYLEWYDEVIEDEYLQSLIALGDTLEVLMDYDKAWAPNIVLVNAVDTVKDIGDLSYMLRYRMVRDSSTTQYVRVDWQPRILLRASCSPDVTYYPFDRQVCDFTYTAWGYFSSEIKLNVLTSEWDTSAAEDNGVWKIIS